MISPVASAAQVLCAACLFYAEGRATAAAVGDARLELKKALKLSPPSIASAPAWSLRSLSAAWMADEARIMTPLHDALLATIRLCQNEYGEAT